MLWFLGIAALVQSLISLRGVRRWLAFVRRSLREQPGEYCPAATVIVPCRGRDHGLEENLAAYGAQDYPDFELLFVTSGPGDPATPAAQAVPKARVTYVPPKPDEGDKVTKLRAAVRLARGEVLVLADSDGRPDARWLRRLIAPLASTEAAVGATTGYRSYVPANLASRVRAVWNSFTASVLDEGDALFCWGGSVAIRRSTFERIGVDGYWQGSVSDDYRLKTALKDAGLPVRFLPSCLVPSIGECGWRELLSWTTRQVLITRVYAPKLWLMGLASNGLYCAGALALALRLPSLPAIVLLGALLTTAGTTGVMRALGMGLPPSNAALLAPVMPFLLFYNFARAGFTRTVAWRGTSYRLLGPQKTVVVR